MADNNLGDLNSILHIKTDPSEIAAAQQQLNAIFGKAQQGLNTINDGIAKIQKVTSLSILGVGLAGIVHQVFQTRSYFQDAASSMKTFLGDADKAAKFTKELQEYAFYNMYEFQDLVGVSKQLIAYGTTDTKEIIKVTDQLSNIATGTGANIYEMVDIFNKIKARGTADGQVLQQLASRGLVVKDVLQQMGETVNGNKITFEQFQKVLTHVTSEGGMFHDLMKDQLNNLSASSAQLSDVLTNMFNEIGEVAEPFMKDAIDLAGMVVENYKEIASVLFDIAKAYGVYKVVASGMDWVENSAHEAQKQKIEEEIKALDDAVESTKALKNADLDEAVEEEKLTRAQADEIEKLREQVEAENDLRVAKGELTKEQAKQIAAAKEGLLRREQELDKIKQQADEEVEALEKEIEALERKKEAQQEEVNVAASFGAEGKDILETEQKKLNTLETQKQELASKKLAAQKRAEAAEVQKNEIATARENAEKSKGSQISGVVGRAMTAAGAAIKGIGSSIVEMINPMGLAVTALGFLAQQCYEVYKNGSLAEQAESRLREAQEEADKEIVSETQNLAQYATTIKSLTEPSEEYAKQLKTLTKGTKEYDEVLEKSKIVNAQLGDAKKGLLEMSKKYQITTTETVNGIQQEMSALDLVTQKYDEYKQKIQDVANFKAYTNYIEAEKKRMQEAVTEYTSYLREDMADVLLRGVKGEARGAKIAEINAALAEYEISMIETGRAPLGGKYKELMDEYLAQIKESDNTFIGGLKNAGKGFKRMFKEGMETLAGDMTAEEYWQTLHENTVDYVAGYVTSMERSVEETVAVGQSALLNARNLFKVTEDPLKEEEERQKKLNANRYKTKIQNDKSVQEKYIKDYAKLAEERYKALKKIEDDYSIDKDVKEYKKAQINAQFDLKVKDIDKSKLKPEEVETLTNIYTNSMVVAMDESLEGAENDMDRLKADIEKLQQERDKILNTERETNAEGNKLTSEERQKDKEARQARANEINAEIAQLTAQMLAYEQVVQRQFDTTDFSKKAAAYEKFAKDYSASLIAVKQQEYETEQKLKDLDKQIVEADSAEQTEKLMRQKENALKELDILKADEEMKRQVLIEGFDGTATDVTDIINNMMNVVTKFTLDELRNQIITTNAKLNKLKARQAMGEDVSAEIAQTTAQLVIFNNQLEASKKELEDLREEDPIDYWNESKKAVGKVTTAFKDLGSAIGGSTEEALNTASMVLTTTVSLVHNIKTFATTSIEAIKTATTAGVAAVKAVEAASVILAIVSAVIQLGQAIASLFNKKDPIDELKDSLHDFNLELEETKRLAANDASFKPFETIFGDDAWGAMTNNIRIGAEALETYEKTQQDIIHNAQTMTGQMKQGVGGAIGSAILTGGWWSGGNHSAVTAAGQYDNVDDTVANMKVKVQHKTWIRNEKSSTLKDFVPSLFDDQGKLDKDALHKFVESNNDAFQKLSQDNQDYLKKMDESWQEYQEAVAAVKDTFSEFFGDLGSQIQDVWTNAFRSGEDGLADFEKSWDSAIENMIQSMAYSKTLGKVMDDMEKDLDKSGFFEDPEGKMGEAIGIMEEYEQKAQASKTAYDAILQEYRDKGYFKNETETRNAVSGGIANVTQDTAEEMNGRLTQIQSHTFAINENMKLMVTMQTTQLTILQGIHTDTGQLHAIRADIASVKAAVSDIQVRGLKLKE